MATQAKLWTVNSITEANRKAGGHWFDPDSMRFFGTRVSAEVYQGPGGVFFITSDKRGPRSEDGRGYTVRQFDPGTASVGTARGTDLAAYTKAGAVKKAKELAGVERASATEAHKPVTILEQFVSDLRTHGDSNTNRDNAESLIELAAKHHKRMEDDCNYGNQQAGDGDPVAGLRKLRQNICLIASFVGAKAVLFSGDPRGCTVKLTFPDGFTNDFAHEGYCVPTSLKADE